MVTLLIIGAAVLLALGVPMWASSLAAFCKIAELVYVEAMLTG